MPIETLTLEARAEALWVAIEQAAGEAADQEFEEHPPFEERPEGMEGLDARVKRLGLVPILAALEAAVVQEREALREKLLPPVPPAFWTVEERDGMARAYRTAEKQHGHYETLFAVASWILRHRLAALDARASADAVEARVSSYSV